MQPLTLLIKIAGLKRGMSINLRVGDSERLSFNMVIRTVFESEVRARGVGHDINDITFHTKDILRITHYRNGASMRVTFIVVSTYKSIPRNTVPNNYHTANIYDRYS